jgi:hypothetical protein
MSQIVSELYLPAGEVLIVRRILPGHRDIKFVRECLRADNNNKGLPLDAIPGWDWIADDGATTQAGYMAGSTKLVEPELYCLYRLAADAEEGPLAQVALLRSYLNQKLDPKLPTWIESLGPWCIPLGNAPVYAVTIVSTFVLMRAKQLGFPAVFLSVSVPPSIGAISITPYWQGYPCEPVQQLRCNHINSPNGCSRPVLPNQLVLSVPLKNIPDL